MTQKQIIEMLLRAHAGQWVAMTELGRAAGCWAVHSRIAEIRRDGATVENLIRVGQDGKKYSYYRIAE